MQLMDLEAVLKPFTITEFLDKYFGKASIYIPGHAAKFNHLLTWSDFNHILEIRYFKDQLNLYKDGKLLGSDTYQRPWGLFAPEFTRLLREGATLTFNGIDRIHFPIGMLAQKLGRRLRCSIGTNVYAAWGDTHGFGVHWDDHDTLILQIWGRKQWRIFDQASPLSVSNQPADLDTLQANWEGMMEAGDLLYIPHGWRHYAKPCNEPTLHLTVGIYRPNTYDVVYWLVERLKQEGWMNEDVPRWTEPSRQDQYVNSVRNTICNALGPDLISRFVHEAKLQSPVTRYKPASVNALSGDFAVPRVRLGLPWTATPNLLPDSGEYMIVLTSPEPFELRDVNEEELEVYASGKAYVFNAETKQLFLFLEEHGDVSIKEFYQRWNAEFEEPDLADFLKDLVAQGLISFLET